MASPSLFVLGFTITLHTAKHKHECKEEELKLLPIP